MFINREEASQVVLVVKNPPANLIPGLGRSPRGEHGNPLQSSCLENAMDRGAYNCSLQVGYNPQADTVGQDRSDLAR